MDILNSLHLDKTNSGTSTGSHWWSNSKEEGEIISYNPATGKPIAATYRSSARDYDHVVKESAQTFLKWREVPAPIRGEFVRAIGNELRAYKDYLGSLIALEMGKSKKEGDGEVQEMIDMADLAVGQSRMLYGNTMHSERPHHRMYEQWHPMGITGVISAFNFPVAVWSWNAFLAAVCGNTVIWKPSPKTPLCAIAVQHICNRVMEKFGYRGIFSLVISDNKEIVKQIAKDERIPIVSFTGSTAVGRIVNQLVSERFGRAILELSGNNAVIVDEHADLRLAVPAIVFSAIGTAGQRCTTTRRIIIHESLYSKFISAMVKAYQSINIGDPLDVNVHMGPLIDLHAVEEFAKTISEARVHGAKIFTGGNILKHPGFFVEPTIISADNDWDVVQRETFAPIVYVMKYKKLEDAIAMQNHSSYGLSSSIFTNNLQHAELFISASGSDCGIANINIGTSGAEIGGAFGGEKETGGGREAGSDAWKAYMRRQTNTINWGKNLTLAQGIKFEI